MPWGSICNLISLSIIRNFSVIIRDRGSRYPKLGRDTRLVKLSRPGEIYPYTQKHFIKNKIVGMPWQAMSLKPLLTTPHIVSVPLLVTTKTVSTIPLRNNRVFHLFIQYYFFSIYYYLLGYNSKIFLSNLPCSGNNQHWTGFWGCSK